MVEAAIVAEELARGLADTPFIETNATYFPTMRVHAAPANQPYWWTIPEEAAHAPPEFVHTNTSESGNSGNSSVAIFPLSAARYTGVR